jgi:hypothetical protein
VSEQAAGTTTQQGEPGAEGAPAADPQIGQLIDGFNSFRGEITGRLDALESDLFEPEGGEPLPGVPDFPAVGAQPPAAGQPTFPAQPAVVPPQGYPQPQMQPQVPGQQQPYPGQQAPAAPSLPPEAAQILDQYIGQRVQEGMAQSQQQLDQRIQAQLSAADRQRELDAYADGLEAKYDEFKDEERTKQLLASTAAFAQQLGQPQLASDPRLLERVLLVERAQAVAAAGGGQAQPGEVHLETTPAAPGGQPSDEDPAAGIVAAARGASFL